MRLLLSAILAVGSAASAPAQGVVVDNDDGAPAYTETGVWTTSNSTGYNGGTYRFTLPEEDPFSTATWTPDIPETGFYEVSAIFLRSDNRTTQARYTIDHADGEEEVIISQEGGLFIDAVELGEFRFEAGTSGSVQLDSGLGGGAYIADAIRFSEPVDDPPVISQVANDPPIPDANVPSQVTARVTDDEGLSSVHLVYSSPSAGSSNLVPALDDGAHGDGAANDDVYGATIPGLPDGDQVSFFIRAQDTGSNVSQSQVAQYTVGEEFPPEYRVIWADSWQGGNPLLSEEDAERFIETCRANNINTVMVEIRKIGDAYYDSSLEPRATNITGGPDYDPLQYLIDLAHDTSDGKPYIHVHGWFVMHRITRGETLHPQHVLSQHPEYIMSTSTGGTTGGTNSYLDPGHPGVIDHNVAVIVDCVENYDIDGINLDYIRYPEYSGDWGYNPVSVQRFNTIHNETGQPAGGDPDWEDWRRENVTKAVKKIYVKSAMADPQVILTADTVNWGFNYDPSDYPFSSAYAGVFQDWVGWLEEGILDYNALMNYSTSDSRFEGWTDLSLANDDKRGSIIGIGAYLQDSVQDSMDQLLYAREAGADGLNIYDWDSEVNAANASRADFYQALRTQVFTTWVDPPEATWKTQPTTGIFEGTVTLDGEPLDHATVRIQGEPGTETTTDGSGWFAILDAGVGSSVLEASFGPDETTALGQIPQAGDIVTVNIELAQEPADSWTLY